MGALAPPLFLEGSVAGSMVDLATLAGTPFSRMVLRQLQKQTIWRLRRILLMR